MKVLLVYSNHIYDVLPAPPVGLSYIASAAKDAGHFVRFLDLLVTSENKRYLQMKLRQFLPDIVGFSVRNIDNVIHQRLRAHLDHLNHQIAEVRALSKAKIIVGGSAISILGSNALNTIDADYAITGEGEETFPLLLNEIENDTFPIQLPGVYCKSSNYSRKVGFRYCENFGASHMERWVKWRRYERLGATWPIQSRRGCPQLCTYCPYPLIEGRTVRSRIIKDVVDEIEKVEKIVSPRCFEFVDSVFNAPESYAISLCEEIIRRNLKVNLTTMGMNVKHFSPELLSGMRSAGFNSMMVTPESGSDQILAKMKKNFTAEEIIRCANMVRMEDIPTMWFFMLGAPGETKETVQQTMDMVRRYLNFKSALVVFTTGIRILPHTDLALQAVADGVLKPDDDLSKSHFYFSPFTSEKWLLAQVDKLAMDCPGVVHAAHDLSIRPVGRLLSRLFYYGRVAPPHWRFFSKILFSTHKYRHKVQP